MYDKLNIKQFLDNEIKRYTEDTISTHYEKVCAFNSEIRQDLIGVCKGLSKAISSTTKTISSTTKNIKNKL